MGKLFTSEMSNRVTASALDIFSAEGGGMEPVPVGRYIRDARLTEIGEGTSEVQRIIIAKELMKDADKMADLPGDRLLSVIMG